MGALQSGAVWEEQPLIQWYLKPIDGNMEQQALEDSQEIFEVFI